MKKETYTKIFLKHLGKPTDPATVKEYHQMWWKNPRQKDEKGLRLTKEGFEILKEIGVDTYTIPYPRELRITANIMIFLDRHISTPYYFDKNAITLTDEKKAIELSLFAGDLRHYGFAKAASKARREKD